ncbi:MAG: hypothetical protein WA783_13215 [Phormidesmis sp.]
MSGAIEEKMLDDKAVKEAEKSMAEKPIEKKPTEQRIELGILKGIRQAEEDIVIAIEKALEVGEYPKNGRDKLEASQFKNLVRVADTTESPEVVKNFLRYQVGRERKWGRGEKSLAEHIVKDIDGLLKKRAGEIASEAKSTETRRIHMELIRRYLGYGSRRLKYLDAMQEG